MSRAIYKSLTKNYLVGQSLFLIFKPLNMRLNGILSALFGKGACDTLLNDYTNKFSTFARNFPAHVTRPEL